MASNGNGFVVVWESATPGSAGLDIRGRRFDQNGEKLTQEFRVNTTVPGDQGAAAVASLNNGFVVTWTSADVSGLGVYTQRYRTDGNRVGVEFRVNSTTASDQIQPAVSGFPQGGYVVVWASPDGNGRGIYGQMGRHTRRQGKRMIGIIIQMYLFALLQVKARWADYILK